MGSYEAKEQGIMPGLPYYSAACYSYYAWVFPPVRDPRDFPVVTVAVTAIMLIFTLALAHWV